MSDPMPPAIRVRLLEQENESLRRRLELAQTAREGLLDRVVAAVQLIDSTRFIKTSAFGRRFRATLMGDADG